MNGRTEPEKIRCSLRETAWLLQICLIALSPQAPAAEERAPLTHGVMVGAVSHDSAIIWSRTDREATMHAWFRASAGGPPGHAQTYVHVEHDYTGKVRLHGLRPDTEYQYAVRFGGDADEVPRRDPASGTFRTAPSPTARKAVRFAWGGALGGQNVCRDAVEGFPIFSALSRLRLDFFVALGDMIYADQTCEPKGKYGNDQIAGNLRPATTRADYWSHWKYAREDRGFREFLAATPYFAIWDDQDAFDDPAPPQDARSTKPAKPKERWLQTGLDAFLDYHPIVPGGETPYRLYRNVRWGKHVELFLLDVRQYRDRNAAEDSPDRPKTMLGREQLTWLIHKLRESDATWKFIVTNVPLSTPTASPPEKAMDGWANLDQNTGFEQELLHILSAMKEEKILNSVWLAADLHFAQGLRLRPFPKDPAFAPYEFVAGPLNAGLFPNRTLDATLRPERLFHFGPEDASSVQAFQQAKHWMNAGAIEVSEQGVLSVQFVNAEGQTVWKSAPLVPK